MPATPETGYKRTTSLRASAHTGVAIPWIYGSTKFDILNIEGIATSLRSSQSSRAVPTTMNASHLPPPQGAPQGGLSCPYGAIHLQGDREAVEGVSPGMKGHSPSRQADSPLWEGAKSERASLSRQ